MASVSDDGGTEPRWAPDGNSIYYLRVDDRQLIKAVLQGGVILDRQPVVGGGWTSANFGGVPIITNWDIHPDGGTFIFVRSARPTIGSEPPLVPIEVAVGWFEHLNRLVPVR